MKEQTAGIVLRYFRYGDSSIIAHIYTEKHGRQAFIFKAAKTRSAKRKINFLQPLALVELPINYSNKKELYPGNGTQVLQVFQSIPFQQVKNSCAFFLAEVLGKLLQIQEADQPLFTFLTDAISFLDKESTKGANFHLTFLVKLMEYFGIQPDRESDDSLEVQATKEEYALWETFQKKTWEECDEFPLAREQRNLFLDKILAYYSFHLQEMGQLKSLAVLQEVFQ